MESNDSSTCQGSTANSKICDLAFIILTLFKSTSVLGFFKSDNFPFYFIFICLSVTANCAQSETHLSRQSSSVKFGHLFSQL